MPAHKASTGGRRREGRFSAAHTDEDLYALVAAVITANGFPPDEHVSGRSWDAGRAVSDEFSDAPTARQIATRLKRDWPSIVTIAQQRPGTPGATRAVITTTRQVANALLDERHLILGLTKVSERTGGRSFGEAEYDSERNAILQQAAREGTRSYWEGLLPSAAQIKRIARDWDVALVMAGLDPRPGVTLSPAGKKRAEAVQKKRVASTAGGERGSRKGRTTRRSSVRRADPAAQADARSPRPTPPPVTNRRSGDEEPLSLGRARPQEPAQVGLAVDAALAEFARSQGAWPSSVATLARWAGHHDVGISGLRSVTTLKPFLAHAAEKLEAGGIEAPAFDSMIGPAAINLEAAVTPGLPRQTRNARGYTEAEVVRAVARCMRATHKTTDVRQRDYLAWVNQHGRFENPRAASPSKLPSFGGFGAVKRRALDLLASTDHTA